MDWTIILPLCVLAITVLGFLLKSKQHRVDRRDALYEPRRTVYNEVREVLAGIVREYAVSADDLNRLHNSAESAERLLGNEVADYIRQMHRRANNLRRLKQNIGQHRPGTDARKSVTDEIGEEFSWFTDQFQVSKEMFRKYLRIGG